MIVTKLTRENGAATVSLTLDNIEIDKIAYCVKIAAEQDEHLKIFAKECNNLARLTSCGVITSS